jgi:hypothetical protein
MTLRLHCRTRVSLAFQNGPLANGLSRVDCKIDVSFAAQSEEKMARPSLRAPSCCRNSKLRSEPPDSRVGSQRVAAKNPPRAARINLDAWVKGVEPNLTYAGRNAAYAERVQINGIQLDQARAEGSLRNGTLTLRRSGSRPTVRL